MRFSLKTLVLIVVFIGALVTLVFLAKQNSAQAERLDELRKKFGIELSVDSSKMTINSLSFPRNNSLAWRVYFPKGKKYKLYFYKGDISFSNNFPEESALSYAVSNESIIFIQDIEIDNKRYILISAGEETYLAESLPFRDVVFLPPHLPNEEPQKRVLLFRGYKRMATSNGIEGKGVILWLQQTDNE